jgi:hypothetical protein
MRVKRTGRGFAIAEFIDLYGATCSIQKSSLASKDAVWLGVDDANPRINRSDGNGWQAYPIPEEVLLTTRMHLSRQQVKKLLPLLQKFADTGELK